MPSLAYPTLPAPGQCSVLQIWFPVLMTSFFPFTLTISHDFPQKTLKEKIVRKVVEVFQFQKELWVSGRHACGPPLGEVLFLVFCVKDKSEGSGRGKCVLVTSPSPPTMGSRTYSPEGTEGTETSGRQATSQVLHHEPGLGGGPALLPQHSLKQTLAAQGMWRPARFLSPQNAHPGEVCAVQPPTWKDHHSHALPWLVFTS